MCCSPASCERRCASLRRAWSIWSASVFDRTGCARFSMRRRGSGRGGACRRRGDRRPLRVRAARGECRASVSRSRRAPAPATRVGAPRGARRDRTRRRQRADRNRRRRRGRGRASPRAHVRPRGRLVGQAPLAHRPRTARDPHGRGNGPVRRRRARGGVRLFRPEPYEPRVPRARGDGAGPLLRDRAPARGLYLRGVGFVQFGSDASATLPA